MEPFEAKNSLEIEVLLSEIRQKVEQRRKDGDYPDQLEEKLDSHFHQLIHQESLLYNFESISNSLQKIKELDMVKYQPIIDSTLPGGSFLHGVASRLLQRHFQTVVSQINSYLGTVSDLLNELSVALQAKINTEYNDLRADLNFVLQRITAYERAPEVSAGGIAELSRRIERLEATEAERKFSPWYSQDRFDQAFPRPTQDPVLNPIEVVEKLANSYPVLEIGCGKGEFLELLKESNIEAKGIDISDELLQQAREKGLDVSQNDAIVELKSTTEGSLGAIVGIQVIQYLSKQQILDLVSLAYDKLYPGGQVVIETINPQSLYACLDSCLDPAINHLVPAAYLSFLFTEMNFATVELLWGNFSLESKVEESDNEVLDGISKVREIVSAPYSYALVATK